MPTRPWAVTLLSCVPLVLAAAQAQTHPDFSGTWKQNNEQSKLAKRASTAQYVNKIAWHAPDLHVTTVTENWRGEYAYSRVFTVDGQPHTGRTRNGEDKQTTVRWDGESLVFETVEAERKTTETWRLSGDGKVLTKILKRGDTEQRYVLDKQ